MRDDRVVPDIWDQKFLPVSRRSVAAPIPENTPRSRALKYGAWYLPVGGWGKSATVKAKQSGGGGVDDVAGLMDKVRPITPSAQNPGCEAEWGRGEGTM